MKLKGLAIGTGLVLAATMSNAAFADDCDNLSNNPNWDLNFSTLENAVDKGDYDTAVETAKVLFGICAQSPALLYYTGVAMKGKGDKERAQQYFVKASENTSEIAVDPGMSRRIWYARYEMEHPEATPEAIKAKADEMAETKRQYADLKTQFDEMNKNIELNTAQRSMEEKFLLQQSKENWWSSMWAGVGIAGAGIALTITGGVLASTSEKIEKAGTPTTEKSGFAITKGYVAGWTLLGAGIAMTIGGTVLTGIAGYHYNAIDLDSDGAKDESVSFNVSPTGVSFGMTF
jgi:hypothetical protein